MSLISIKAGSEFLEMDKASIRISYTNNLFEQGAAPGINSYPFDLPATNNNLRILGQHNRLDNPESLSGTVPVSVMLDDNLYFNALLNFQSIGKNIKASLTPTLAKAYSEFSNQKLNQLDYGEYNKFWLPEIYRYSIGYFHFTDLDLLEFNCGDNLTPINYNQAWTGDPESTVFNLIDQVNADTAIHFGTMKYLKKEIVGTDYKYWVLVKGNEKFNQEPYRIESVTFGQYVEVLGNRNTYFTGRESCNEAVHMLNITNPVFSDRSLYEMSFGYIPWEFPVIYNEEFFGPLPAASYAENNYNYHINTYWPTTDQFLWDYVLSEDRNFARGHSPACPQPHLKFVLQNALKNNSLNLETTFFNHPELASLLMLNLYHQSKIDAEELTYQGPQYFELAKCMADITVDQLCVGMKKSFSQHFFYDFQNAIVRMLSSREILDSTDYIDLNPILLEGKTIEPIEDFANGFKIQYQFTDSDQYPSEDIKDIKEYIITSPVNRIPDLPTSGNWQGHIKLVVYENQYWIVNDEVIPNTWKMISENLLEELIGNGSFEILSELAPVLMIKNAPIRTGVSSTGSGESIVYTNTIANSGFNIPKVKQQGNSPFHKLMANTWQGRLMFFRGMDTENMYYPVAGYDSYWETTIGITLHQKFYDYSLKLTGTEGTINQFHEPFIRHLSAIKKKVTVQALLSKEQILNFQIWKYYRVENQNMLCAKMDVIFDNPSNTIKPAQFELYKK